MIASHFKASFNLRGSKNGLGKQIVGGAVLYAYGAYVRCACGVVGGVVR